MIIANPTYRRKRFFSPRLSSPRGSPVRARDYAPSFVRRLWLRLTNLWSVSWRLGVGATVVGILTFACIQTHYETKASKMDLRFYTEFDQRNDLYDTEGLFLRSLPGPTSRKCVDGNDLPQCLVEAVVAMEDRAFFEHRGLNWRGILRAAWQDLQTFSFDQGGSSITQQSIKLALERGHESGIEKLDRKLLEMQLAKRIERNVTKEEILACYFNRIDFGAGLHGVHAACQGLFGKEVGEINQLEAATLVAILRGPDDYSPFKHPERCRSRRNLVLARMVEEGHLKPSDAPAMLEAPLAMKLKEWQRKQMPDELTNLVSLELRQCIDPARLAKGGLQIRLTLDSQWAAEVARRSEAHLRSIEARRRPSSQPLQTAVVFLDDQSGAIRVMVGGRPTVSGSFNRVTQMARQGGSIFKAPLYMTAFASGARPEDLVDASAIRHGELSFGPPDYSPRNTGTFDGKISLREALYRSVNTATVRVGDRVGLDRFAGTIGTLGIADPQRIPESPTVFLGAVDVRPIDIAAGYTVFANRGPQCAEPHIIDRITDFKGRFFYAASTSPRRGCDPSAAIATASCLKDVVERGTARAAHRLGLQGEAIGKTGTTNGTKDAWFVGSAGGVTGAVWVGFDRPEHILNAYASKLALPLWVNSINARAEAGVPVALELAR